MTVLLGLLPCLSAQDKSEPADSLVRLMSAQSAQMMKNENGVDVRKVIGPARFLHNNTYLICDTALWYVESRVINAFGHVKILQDETELTSDKLDYYIDEDLAQFRGSVVQLQDKDRNTLRTRYLDYNTKDSVALFRGGASMRDKDGQIIESNNGSYDSKTKLFTFNRDVNMFTDSVFVNTVNLLFHGDTQMAEFDHGVDAWKDRDMLSADRGYYDRDKEIFRFYDNVHGMTDVQEGWADTLYFHKLTGNLEMYGNVQLRDTSRRVAAMAESIHYVDSIATLTMQTDATVVAEVKDTAAAPGASVDTIYVGADKVIYWTQYKCAIDQSELAASEKRLSDIALDPVAEYRKRAAEAAAAAEEEAKRKREEEMGRKPAAAAAGTEGSGAAAEEPAAEPEAGNAEAEPETAAATEPVKSPESASEAVPESENGTEPEAGPEPETGEDTEVEAGDTEEQAADSTKVGFLAAIGNVRVFKSDMQARCDSLAYTDLDSLARMYIDPMVWNEQNRQYSADSISIQSENSRMRKADLMSNAFITIQEDSVCFDQIRGTEMMAFFDTTTVLERFDAIGGASAVFFLEENESLATVNRVESKMLTASFVNGGIDKIWYYDNPHNDAYPAVQLPSDDRRMKGFRWNPELRPTGKEDITPYDLRTLEREEYAARKRPVFIETDLYFPGYMAQVYAGIAQRDSLRRVEKMRAHEEQEPVAETAPIEETVTAQTEEPSQESSGAEEPRGEEVEVDLKDLPDYIKSRKEEERQAKRDARWAELDAKDAAKEAAKAEKRRLKAEKLAARMDKADAKETAREQKLFDRYVKHYKKQKRNKTFKLIRESKKAAAKAAARLEATASGQTEK